LSKSLLTANDLKQLRLEEKKYNKKLNKNKRKTFRNRFVLYEYVHFDFKFKQKANTNYNQTNINVMFLVLDGVSLSSMKRALPRTLTFLNSSREFFLFEKHHVIGSNTFENLVPMLTNIDAKQILGNRSNAFLRKPFDDLPLIWKKFSQKFEFLHFFKNLYQVLPV